jgi:hypothetical protein
MAAYFLDFRIVSVADAGHAAAGCKKVFKGVSLKVSLFKGVRFIYQDGVSLNKPDTFEQRCLGK